MRRAAALLVLGSVAAGAACIATPAAALGPVDTILISGALSGAPSSSAFSPSISSDGRYVAFESDADNLVADDTNDSTDVFIRDTLTGTTTRVSVGYEGELPESSYSPKISANGRYVAFLSDSDEVVPDDFNSWTDAFVRDLQTGTTKIASVTPTGGESEEGADEVAISGDGRWVAFSTWSALVAGDTNDDTDVYARDTVGNTTVRLSGSTGGGWEPSVDGTGRYFSYTGNCGDQTCVNRRDRQTSTTLRISSTPAGAIPNNWSYQGQISSDGMRVAFASDASNLLANTVTNNMTNVYVRDITAATTTRVNVSSTGGESNNYSFEPMVSDDGRYVSFSSAATNLTAVPGTGSSYNIYVRDLTVGVTERFSRTATGGQLNSDSFSAVLARNGSSVAFISLATDLLPGITEPGQVYRASISNANLPSTPTAVSAAAGDASATVSWTPASDGGSPLTGYVVTSSPGGITAAAGSGATNVVVGGLTNGTSYTFTVRAQNALGYSNESSASNAVTPAKMTTPPSAPQAVSAVGADATATVSWSAPASDGGSAITGYVVTSTPGGFTATAGPTDTNATVNGLTNGTPYTFTVRAQNTVGDGPESSASNSVTPATVPSAPQSVSAVGADAAATVSWSAPASDGGSTITGYVVTANPGGLTATTGVDDTSAAVTGLTNGTAYTFTVRAQNAVGDGPESDPSNSVTPASPIPVETVSIGDVTIVEGDSGLQTIKFPVTLSHAADHEVRVNWTLSDLGATGATKVANGVDYGNLGGATKTLIFKPSRGTGLTPVAKVVSVKVFVDGDVEDDEAFRVTLSNPTGGYELNRGLGTGTIIDDDGAAPGPRLTIGDVTIVRSGSGAVTAMVPVTMSSAVATQVSVPYTVTSGDATWTAKATGGDYGGKTTGTLAVAAGKVTRTLNIKLWPGTPPTSAKQITITLGTPNNPSVTATRATSTITIVSGP